jgi:uncharacterized protein YcfJ
MKKLIIAILGLGTLLVGSHAAAQVTFYEQDGFRGKPFNVNWTVTNFDHYGFNDRASSAIVEHGQWEVCEDANFNGRCAVLRPGQYPNLNSLGLNNRISSARPVQGKPTAAYAPPPPPPPAPTYAYYPRHDETLYDASVVAVRAVVGPPEQHCWVEQQQVQKSDPNIAGAVIGGVLGGVLGHQIGSGRGNDVATAVGAVGGAVVGSNVNRGSQTTTQNVKRCETVPGSEKVSYWDVTYVFRGVTHRAQLSYAPGATIQVNGKGEPRA